MATKIPRINVADFASDKPGVFVKLVTENSGKCTSHFSKSGARITAVDGDFNTFINRIKNRYNKRFEAEGRGKNVFGYWDILRGLHSKKSDGTPEIVALPQEVQQLGTRLSKTVEYDNYFTQREVEDCIVVLTEANLSNPNNNFLSLDDISDEDLAETMDTQAIATPLLDQVLANTPETISETVDSSSQAAA